MKLTRIAQLGAVTAVTALALAGCTAANETASDGATTAPSTSGLAGTLNATGASSQTAAQEAWVANFQTANSDVTVNYEPTGSGTGRENFISGASNFIGSDRSFNDEELAAGGFGACASDDIVQLPLYISPVAVAFNLDGIESLNMDTATIAGIFAGDITTWNDPAIAAANPGVDLPDLAIAPVHRSDDSGTTETFTTYLAEAAPDAWTHEPDGEWPIAGGEAAQGTSGVVDATRNGTGTIVYADASQVQGLGTVSVKVGDAYVAYSADAAAAIVDSSPFLEGRDEGDLSLEIDYATDAAGVYPIALVSYLIACQSYDDPDVAAVVSAYLTYIASSDGQQAAADNAGSAPISDSLRSDIDAAIALIG